VGVPAGAHFFGLSGFRPTMVVVFVLAAALATRCEIEGDANPFAVLGNKIPAQRHAERKKNVDVEPPT